MEPAEILKIVITLAMSAVIGIFTNYIAVKMLFRPYREKYIGKWRIPFTPGIIPRRQGALAKALGRMISESLVRTEDLKNALLSDEISGTIAKGILAFPSIRSSCEKLFGDEQYEEKRDLVLDKLTNKILEGILRMNVGEVIAGEAAATVQGFASKNPLVSIFVTDHMIAQLSQPIGEKVTNFLNGDGKAKLRAALEDELAVWEQKPVGEWMKDTESFEKLIIGLYRRLVDKYAGSVASQFHIDAIVEAKVNAMPPEALEELLLSIMKKELNAIIWLGGIIGLLLGGISVLTSFIL
ncbi:MAG: DUF445 family protein [Clostridia bacterium]|nr:DUF445 family protein [Clostridia bacterium]